MIRSGEIFDGRSDWMVPVYETDPAKLSNARATVSTDPAVRIWTVGHLEYLTLQALAIMHLAGVLLPPGSMEELISCRVPPTRLSGVDTEFFPWANQDLQARLQQGSPRNLGEIRVGDNLQPGAILLEFPHLSDNQVRRFQLRGMIHELFHALDFHDVVQMTQGDLDAAIALQVQYIEFMRQRSGYARNEIQVDGRAGLVIERSGLMFTELRQSFDAYRQFWEGENPTPEVAFAQILVRLNRTRYP